MMRNMSLDIFPRKASAKIAQTKLSGLVALQHMGTVLLPWRLSRRSSLRIPRPNPSSLQHCIVRREDYVTSDPTLRLLSPHRNFDRSLGLLELNVLPLPALTGSAIFSIPDPITTRVKQQPGGGRCEESHPLALHVLISSPDSFDIAFCDVAIILDVSPYMRVTLDAMYDYENRLRGQGECIKSCERYLMK